MASFSVPIRTRIIGKFLLIAFSFIVLLVSSSCGTLEVRIEHTSTPDQKAIATLASLMFDITQKAEIATQRAIPMTPTPETGLVKGTICYPGDHTPMMKAYFRNIATNQLTVLDIQEFQTSYMIRLPPGDYYAFAWTTKYQLGGMYSQAVACGLNPDCTDHTPLSFAVSAGTDLERIDLCDWPIPTDELPLPTGYQLP